MPKYVIERDIPGTGNLTPEQLKGISETSCGVLSNMGSQIQWFHSYVTGHKIYCVYIAPNNYNKIFTMNLKKNFFFVLLFLFPALSFAQVKIGDTTGVINPKAVLELKDTARGFLLPRMTTAQMNAIATPPDGLMVYNNSAKNIYQ